MPKHRFGKLVTVPDHYFVKTADVIVYRDGEYAVAVDTRTRQIIAKSTDHSEVWNSAVREAPENGVVAGKGKFEIKSSIIVNKPLTVRGGYFYRSLSVGSSPGPAIFVLGNLSSDDPLVDNITIENTVIDGYGRYFVNDLGQTYGETNGAPSGRVAIYVKRAKNVKILNNYILDHQRSAINLITVSSTSGVYDHEEVIIKGNVIVNWGDDAITIESVRKVIISDNIMVGGNPNGTNGQSACGVALNYLSISDVTIEGNIIDGMVPEGFPYSGTYGRLGIRGGNATYEEVKIAYNEIKNWYIGIHALEDVLYNDIYDCDIGISIAYGNNIRVIGNRIINFRDTGIYGNGTSTSITIGNIVKDNYLDPGSNTPSYGIRADSYAQYNIFVNNVIKGTYSANKAGIWVNYNLCDNFVWSSTQLTALDLTGFPDTIPTVQFLYYDGTYYYLVIADLINKAVRKVQLS